VTYRIHRSATPDAVVFALSGDLDAEHAARLKEFLASEDGDRVALDLHEVTLVDREAVCFLAAAEAAGIRRDRREPTGDMARRQGVRR
jgi:anti-anti-sigma regulatory factor